MYIQHIGAIKVKQLAEITTEDRMIRYNVQVCEWGRQQQDGEEGRGRLAGCGGRYRRPCCRPQRRAPSFARPPSPQEYERCLKYIFPCCSKKAGRHIDQTLAIMDVKARGLGAGAGRRWGGRSVEGGRRVRAPPSPPNGCRRAPPPVLPSRFLLRRAWA